MRSPRRHSGQLSLLLPIDGAAPLPAVLALTEAQIEAAFAEWYAEYPNKRHPRHALQAFRRVLRAGEATIEQLTEGRNRYVEECRYRRRERRFVLHPATFLNGGCWADDFDDASTPVSAGTAALARVGAALGAARRNQ